ncbi:MAG: hypothetical protein Q7J98_02150 [Kiritimatiellia bacterium]|nr:hypothetical protein [Kiritimatiellia bacterium]
MNDLNDHIQNQTQQQQITPTSAADNPDKPKRARYKIGSWIPATKWQEVKKSFIENGLTIIQLAVVYGLNRNTIAQKACRERWKIQRQDYQLKKDEHQNIRHEEANENLEDEVGKIVAGKKACIEKMVKIATTLLSKMELRLKTLASSDDKEINRTAETMVSLYRVLEDLLGIGKGEGDQGKVKANQVQAHILSEVVEAVDELNARAIREGSCGNCPLKDKKEEEKKIVNSELPRLNSRGELHGIC